MKIIVQSKSQRVCFPGKVNVAAYFGKYFGIIDQYFFQFKLKSQNKKKQSKAFFTFKKDKI